jgi:outer membrane lipoprotein-sorting protein
MRATFAALVVVSTLVVPAAAAPPDVRALVQRMKAALEPARPGVRRLTLTVDQDGETSQLTVGEARKQMSGGAWRILLSALAPSGIQGTSYLVQEGGPARDTQWLYLPYVRRVRTVASTEAYSAFLNSDFTYADLGFVGTGATYTLLGEGAARGAKTYRIQAVPKETWYYSRWVTTIDAETGMPISRDIYDTGNHLWKRQRWERVTVIDGVALPTQISMEDVQARSRSDIRVTGADYDASLPDTLFDPEQLPAAGRAAVWSTVGD